MDILSKTVEALPAAHTKRQREGRWKPALLAIAVPLGLVAIVWFVFRDQLARTLPVETGRVILLEQDSEKSLIETITTIELMKGIVNTSMVYHHVE